MRRRWRCFHCDEVFTREVDAAEHFGGAQGSLVACQIKGFENNLIRKIREQEAELVTLRSEDTELLRALASLQGEVAERVRRAEELGFAQGVHEMRRLAEKQFGAEVVI